MLRVWSINHAGRWEGALRYVKVISIILINRAVYEVFMGYNRQASAGGGGSCDGPVASQSFITQPLPLPAGGAALVALNPYTPYRSARKCCLHI